MARKREKRIVGGCFVLKYMLAAAAILGVTACSEPDQVLVDIEQGSLAGFREDNASWFRNIPFAAAPVGELRWQAPQPPTSWQGLRDATEYGPACMQSTRLTGFLERLLRGNGLSDVTVWFVNKLQPYLFNNNYAEDCLTLNIVTPDTDKSAKRPVMVWIHGGSYESGSGSTSFYNSTAMAKRDVVLVTINYRLGIFGFFGHPELSAAHPDNISGNYGMLDQIAAVEWVRDNIAAFGGDPENITIFGESAGAYSVGTLMASPTADGLYQQAILQSGCGFTIWGRLRDDWRHKTGLETHGAEIAGGADAAALARMQAMPALDLMALYEDNPELAGTFRPVIDGKHLPESPADMFAKGNQSPVPMLLGWNKDEGTLFVGAGAPPLVHRNQFPETRGDYEAMVTEAHEAHGAAILEAYPWTETAYKTNSRLHGDSRFAAPCLEAVHSHIGVGHDAWIYNFDRVPPDPDQTIGAYHAAEIPFVFNTHFGLLPSSDHDAVLTESIADSWAAFAKTGKADWAAYDSDRRLVRVYDNDAIRDETPGHLAVLDVLRGWTRKLQQED